MPAPERDLTPEEIARLLDRRHLGDPVASDELFEAIDRHFRNKLKPQIVRQFREASGNTSIGYSVMVSKFFAEVLERRNDPFWKQQTLQAMCGYAAKAIANDIRDVLRRRKKREPIGENDLIDLAESRATHIMTEEGLDLAASLDLDAWERRPEPWPQRALVFRLWFVWGMAWKEIKEKTGLPMSTAHDHLQRALEALRSELRGGEQGGAR